LEVFEKQGAFAGKQYFGRIGSSETAKAYAEIFKPRRINKVIDREREIAARFLCAYDIFELRPAVVRIGKFERRAITIRVYKHNRQR